MENKELPTRQAEDDWSKFPQDLSSPHRFDPHRLIDQWFQLSRPDPSLSPSDYWNFVVDGVEIMRFILNDLHIEFCVMESLIDFIFENHKKYKARFTDFPSPSFLLRKSTDGTMVIFQLLDKMGREWSKRRYVMTV